MGNENQKSDFDQDNWDIVAKIGDKTVLKNKMTFSLLDLHECQELSQSASSRKAEQIFDWRKQRSIQEHIPLLYHYEVHRAMIGSSQKHKVFTEHITRLSELPPFSKQEAFLILEHIIEVLPLLYKHFGLFHANIYTVGVNDSGKVKVWINQNFAKNYVDEEDVIKNPSQNLQLTIVNNLVRMLKTKVYNNEAKPKYPFSLNFLQTLKYIKQTKQKHVEYSLSKVYLNRDEFNQVYKASLGQKLEISPVKNEIMLDANQHKIAIQTVKTEISQSPTRQYYAPVYNPIHNNFFPPQNARQIIYFPINNPQFQNMAIYHQEPHQMVQRNHQIVNLNQNNTMQLPIPILQQPKKFPSPQKQERRDLSPSNFMKRVKIQQNEPRNSSPNNRLISLSPSKRRDNRPPTSQKKEQEKPNWIRPTSINKRIVRRQLSRIVEQEQTRNDSFHMYHPKKGQEGFNVQLVQSIYVKTNETENNN